MRIVQGMVMAVIVALAAGCAAPPKRMALAPAASFAPEAMTAQTLLNAHRTANGRKMVMLDPSLTRMAQALADACVANPRCDHTTGGTIPQRLAAVGFRGVRAAAENLRRNEASIEGAFAWWKQSSVHNANMLLSSVTRMGFARSAGATAAAKSNWVLIVASDP